MGAANSGAEISPEGGQAARPAWPPGSELVSLVLDLEWPDPRNLPTQGAIELHKWFVAEISAVTPQLGEWLHSATGEKPFACFIQHHPAAQVVCLTVSALAQPMADALALWLLRLPERFEVLGKPVVLRKVRLAQPATTYTELLVRHYPRTGLIFTFCTPTVLRRRGMPLPLPWPSSVWGSWLRRWNEFSGMPIDPEAFSQWVEGAIFLLRHRLESCRAGGAKGAALTGFIGSVEFALTREGRTNEKFLQYCHALAALAPYCGTGQRTNDGLGLTISGWRDGSAVVAPPPHAQLTERISQLAERFLAQRKRTGGERARQVAETWAVILARREQGESLQTIASDIGVPYETVKTYAKLARRALREG